MLIVYQEVQLLKQVGVPRGCNLLYAIRVPAPGEESLYKMKRSARR
jgi:hypothetical protein